MIEELGKIAVIDAPIIFALFLQFFFIIIQILIPKLRLSRISAKKEEGKRIENSIPLCSLPALQPVRQIRPTIIKLNKTFSARCTPY